MATEKKKLVFQNIAKVVREARTSNPWSQSEVARMLGMKNGQFISNMERGLCSMPEKYIYQFCKIMKVDPNDMVNAILQDHKEALYLEINKGMIDEDRSVPTL